MAGNRNPFRVTTWCGSDGTRRALRHSQEVVMRIVRENLYPVTVLVCWLISSAYTLYLIA